MPSSPLSRLTTRRSWPRRSTSIMRRFFRRSMTHPRGGAGGALVGRVPIAVRPIGGQIRNGDFASHVVHRPHQPPTCRSG
jgi:hypothetical protein